jgi:methylated-DNA-[protein]-cysteine S-methyltransferase
MSATTTIDSPVGPLTLVSDGEALTELHFGWEPASANGGGGDPVLEATREQLAAYFAGERTAFELPIRLAGTAFQQAVWAALREIPYAETIDYGELARRVGRPGAARAVGLANGRNPVAIVVPCHRVIGSSGALTGYGGGLERKRALLELEARTARW